MSSTRSIAEFFSTNLIAYQFNNLQEVADEQTVFEKINHNNVNVRLLAEDIFRLKGQKKAAVEKIDDDVIDAFIIRLKNLRNEEDGLLRFILTVYAGISMSSLGQMALLLNFNNSANLYHKFDAYCCHFRARYMSSTKLNAAIEQEFCKELSTIRECLTKCLKKDNQHLNLNASIALRYNQSPTPIITQLEATLLELPPLPTLAKAQLSNSQFFFETSLVLFSSNPKHLQSLAEKNSKELQEIIENFSKTKTFCC